MDVLVPRARELARAAARARIGFNIDAEEAERLDLSLDVIEALLRGSGAGRVGRVRGGGAGLRPALRGGDRLAGRAGGERLDRRIMVRLVKGAYWDAEVKQAQERGLPDFPVFTRKPSTDASYLANARRLLEARERIYPQFATHNAHTVAAVLALAGDRRGVRVPAAARHGRGAARDRARARGDALPDLCAGGGASRPAGVSGAAAAGERGELVVREPDRRQAAGAGGDRGRSAGGGGGAGARFPIRGSGGRRRCSRRG